MWLTLFRDAVYLAIWLASFGSDRINSGGEQVKMEKGANGSGRREIPSGVRTLTAAADYFSACSLGLCWFRVERSFSAEAGAGTAPSSTMSLADSFFP
jgi:hypothetical protein